MPPICNESLEQAIADLWEFPESVSHQKRVMDLLHACIKHYAWQVSFTGEDFEDAYQLIALKMMELALPEHARRISNRGTPLKGYRPGVSSPGQYFTTLAKGVAWHIRKRRKREWEKEQELMRGLAEDAQLDDLEWPTSDEEWPEITDFEEEEEDAEFIADEV